MVNKLNFASGNTMYDAFGRQGFNSANAFGSNAFPGAPTPPVELPTSNLTREGFQDFAKDEALQQATQVNYMNALPAIYNFGKDLFSGTDGRELVNSAIVNGATAVASALGTPLAGAGVNIVSRPIAEDISSFGSSSQATQNSIGNRIASLMLPGLYDVNRGLGKYGLDEINEAGRAISSGLGKTGLFGTQNKGSQIRKSLNAWFNDVIKNNNLELDTDQGDGLFDDYYGDFAVEDDGQGGKTSKVGRRIDELKASVGEQDIMDMQRVGGLFAVAGGLEDAGRGNVANSLVLNNKGNKGQFKKFMEATGATPESLFAKALQAFGDGKMSVVELVESVRSLDRIYGTGFAGEEVVANIARLVEEGGPDRLVDGSVFEVPEGGGEFRREDFLDDEGNPRDLSNSTLINNLATITGQEVQGESQVTNENVPSSVERNNLIDSFSRVQENRSLTPDNPVNDIKYSMIILEKKLKEEGKDPSQDADIKRAMDLIKELGG